MNHTSEQQEIIHKEVKKTLFHAIYGSNRIEHAGLGWDATWYLCHKTLNEPDSILEVNEDGSDFDEKIHDLYAADPTLRGKSRSHVVRGRREVIQHLRAFEYILDRFWVHKEDLTEDLIKRTHEILCKGVSIIDPGAEYPDVPHEIYAGKYRDVPVGAGNTMFVMPQYVPAKMAEMCANLKSDMEGKEVLDPFSLADKLQSVVIKMVFTSESNFVISKRGMFISRRKMQSNELFQSSFELCPLDPAAICDFMSGHEEFVRTRMRNTRRLKSWPHIQ